MIILSPKKATAKGRAFEDFVSILFSRLGYEVTDTRVQKTGRELDIRARARVTDAPLIAECKGHASSTTAPMLRKFYGDYDHEYRKPTPGLVGVMLSTAGFNSPAREWYSEKSEDIRQRFHIVGPERIMSLAVDAGLIAPDAVVRHEAAIVWPFDLGDTLLVITETRLYRVQILKRGGEETHFIAYREHCGSPTEHEVQRLRREVTRLKKLEPHNLFASKKIMLTLARADRPLPPSEVSAASDESMATAEAELSSLAARKLVELVEGQGYVLVEDMHAFQEMARELLPSESKYRFLSSRYFRRMNTPELVDYCFRRRLLDPPAPNERDTLMRVFSVSPSTLHEALFGDIELYKTTAEHMGLVANETNRLEGIRRSQFSMELMPYLLLDLHDRENCLLREMQPVVGLKEAHDVAVAHSGGLVFELGAAGFSTYLQAKGDIKAGQPCSTSPMTASLCEMTMYHLTKDAQPLHNLTEIYESRAAAGADARELAGLANNAGLAHLMADDLDSARRWFDLGLTHCDDMAVLYANLARVLLLTGDNRAGAEALERARAIDTTLDLREVEELLRKPEENVDAKPGGRQAGHGS